MISRVERNEPGDQRPTEENREIEEVESKPQTAARRRVMVPVQRHDSFERADVIKSERERDAQQEADSERGGSSSHCETMPVQRPSGGEQGRGKTGWKQHRRCTERAEQRNPRDDTCASRVPGGAPSAVGRHGHAAKHRRKRDEQRFNRVEPGEKKQRRRTQYP